MVVLTAAVAVALVLSPTLWRGTRALVTITHEGGHAVAALLCGRRLHGIRLHSDTSGLTVSSGRRSGPGMVATLVAGYLGPAVVGLGAVGLLLGGHSLGLLWLVVLLLGAMLLQIRNFYGAAVVIAVGLVLVAISWFLDPVVQSALAYLLTWTLLVAAPKPVLELMGEHRRGRGRGSDADQLARLTRTPAVAWTVCFLLLDLAGLVVGAALLLPALVALGPRPDRLRVNLEPAPFRGEGGRFGRLVGRSASSARVRAGIQRSAVVRWAMVISSARMSEPEAAR